MGGTNEYNAKVHAEIKYLENLRVGEEEDDDAAELGERDAGEDGGTHVDDGVVSAPNTRPFRRYGEGTCNVRTKLDRYTNRHHQIHHPGHNDAQGELDPLYQQHQQHYPVHNDAQGDGDNAAFAFKGGRLQVS